MKGIIQHKQQLIAFIQIPFQRLAVFQTANLIPQAWVPSLYGEPPFEFLKEFWANFIATVTFHGP